MGDDDVICLSSDDETTAKSLPQKSKIVGNPIKDEFQSNPRPDKSLKRKAQPEINNETITSEVKRSKCSANGVAEEVIILSPQKSENVKSHSHPISERTTSSTPKPKLSMHVEKVHMLGKILGKNPEFKDSSKKELPRRDSSVSSSCDKILSSRHHGNSASGNKEKPMLASTEAQPKKSGVRSNETALHTSEAKKSNIVSSNLNKNTDHSREKFEKTSKINGSYPSCSNSSMSTTNNRTRWKSANYAEDKRKHSLLVPNLLSVCDSNSLNGLGCKTPQRNSSNETINLALKGQVDTSHPKSLQKTTISMTEPAKIVEEPKSTDSLSISEGRKSFEVEIVETLDVPIADRLKHPSKDTTRERENTGANMKESVSESSVAQKPSEIESPKSRNRKCSIEIGSSNKSPNSSDRSKFHESFKLAEKTVDKSPPENIPPESDSVRSITRISTSPEIEIVEETKSSRIVKGATSAISESTGNSHASESSPKSSRPNGKTTAARNSTSPKTKIESGQREEKNIAKSWNKDVSLSKAGIPKSTSEIGSRIVDSKIDENLNLTPDRAKSTKLSLMKSPDNIKKKIVPRKIPTSIEFDEPKSNNASSEVSNVKDDDFATTSSSKDESKHQTPFEPVAGCSKTPDEMFVAKQYSKKKKSSPDASLVTTLEEEEEKPTKKLESSESTDKSEIPRKPRLIVKTKEPVVSVKHDTFAMFLSLCLQTKRGEAMEKIVGKLKRYYDQLDPVYARSQEFTDLLNSRREKIIAKGSIYHYIGQIFEEMKMRRGRGRSVKSEANSKVINEMETLEGENELNDEEDPRLRERIKTITNAMKKCSKMIQRLEVAEVNFDDDNDSDYIKLERYKRKMIELYTKLCEYTNEHADAGRAYLRPKHLRVTQIPSIDQAINSFINSKISHNLKKAAKGQSFVDGLIFPDYVDILECVEKVNNEQNLGLDKRRQQALAKEAFTHLGRHLQQARQRDYWDTFSLQLEEGEDPAAADTTLAEKLSRNQEIAEKNTREIFEEYVRKQDEGNGANDESSSSEDDRDEDDDDDENNEKTSNNDAQSEFQLFDDENNDFIDENEDKDDPPIALESTSEVQGEKACEGIDSPTATVEVEDITNENDNVRETDKKKNVVQDVSSNGMTEISAGIEPNKNEGTISESPTPCEIIREDMEEEATEVTIEDETNENNNVLKVIETKISKQVSSSNGTKESSIDQETMEIEVKCAEADKEQPMKPAIDEPTDNEVNHAEPDTDAGIDAAAEQPRALRIRSFARPPSSWASSQEMTLEVLDVSPKKKATSNNETIDLLEDEPSNSACTTSITEVSVSPRIVRITRSIPPNSKEATGTRMPKILPKIAPATKPRTLNGCPSIIIAPQNRSTLSQASNFTKIVPPSQDLTKKITLLPGVTIRPVNNSTPQNSFRPANLTNSSIGTVRTLNVPQNIRIAANAQNQMNVRLRPLDIAQNIQLRVGKNVRSVPPDQVQILRLANTNDLARSNDVQASSALQPRCLVNSNNQILRMPVSQGMQPRAPNPGQNVRIRVAGNVQVSRPTQPQILRLSDGQLVRAPTATIRPLSASSSQIQGITLKNPRFIRLKTSNNAASPAVSTAVTRSLADNGQLRVERIENAPQQHCRRLSNVDDSRAIVQPATANIGHRTNPVLKPNTSNNTPSNNRHRKRNNSSEHKKSCTVSNSEPPSKK